MSEFWLAKSYCLPLLVYCIGALRMTRTSVQFAGMTLLEEFFTINVLNQLSACKMLSVLYT